MSGLGHALVVMFTITLVNGLASAAGPAIGDPVGTPEGVKVRGRMERVLQDPDRYFSDIAPLVEEVRTNRMVEFRSSLQKLLVLMQEKSRPSYTRRVNPEQRVMRAIAATLFALDVHEKGVSAGSDTVEFVLGRIGELSARGHSYDAQTDFLRQNATELYQGLLSSLDRCQEDKAKETVLLALRSCHATGLEDELLARVPSYENQPYVLSRILGTLSEVGGDKSAVCFRQIATTGPEDMRDVARRCLERLAALRQGKLPPRGDQ